jgi:hypothetical protein
LLIHKIYEKIVFSDVFNDETNNDTTDENGIGITRVFYVDIR